jgi:RibD domain-containing protein
MLIYSMSVSVDGYIADRDGAFGWGAPSDELFAFHLARVRDLGAHLCGRRLYETMLPWETDPTLRATDLGAEFADVWSALPKVVFSRTLDRVPGNARLAGIPPLAKAETVAIPSTPSRSCISAVPTAMPSATIRSKADTPISTPLGRRERDNVMSALMNSTQ